MRYCKTCVMPDTKPGLKFNDDGICSACISNQSKKLIDWDARANELQTLCDQIRGTNGNGYDCIVPISGGKDGVYQTWMMKEVYKMKVLCVTMAPHIPTSEGIANLNSHIENLGVDHIKVTVKNQPYREVRRTCFFERGEPTWVEHLVMFSGVARISRMYRVPLVVWGEDIAVEFGGTGGEKQKASAENLVKNDLIKDAKLEQYLGPNWGEADTIFYRHPEIEELKMRGVRSIYLGYYHFWDGYKNLQKAKEFGFQPRRLGPLSGNVLNYDNIDEKLCEISIWFKFLKFGFWRPTDQCCYHIWNGRMTREEAVKLVNEKQYEFPKEYLKENLEFHKITEAEFWEIVEKYRNHQIWEKVKGQWRLKTPLV